MCDYGSYCCREVDDHNNCCNNATAPKISTNFLGAFKFETSTFGVSTTVSAAAATATSEPTKVFGTAITSPVVGSVSTPTNTASPTASTKDVCKDEKRRTAVVGGTISGLFSAAILGLLGVLLYMHKKEKRQRKLKEHYESQFETSWAYRNGNRPRTVLVEADAGSVRTMVEKEGEIVVWKGKG